MNVWKGLGEKEKETKKKKENGNENEKVYEKKEKEKSKEKEDKKRKQNEYFAILMLRRSDLYHHQSSSSNLYIPFSLNDLLSF